MNSNNVSTVDLVKDDLRGAPKKEAFHQKCEANMFPFSFKRPEGIDIPQKAIVKIKQNDNESVNVQILNDGGDNNLHYHPNTDTVWFVLQGQIRFYGPGDKVIGEYGVHEGIVMPLGARYWFEKLGEEEAHLLQVAIFPKGQANNKRIDVSGKLKHQGTNMHIDGATGVVIKR
ncbi:MAG: cupin domain-containing protein [Rhodospirillales bacterium]|jgi:mannose-6-phosphate isomerase-like protein (cupin superfamily)